MNHCLLTTRPLPCSCTAGTVLRDAVMPGALSPLPPGHRRVHTHKPLEIPRHFSEGVLSDTICRVQRRRPKLGVGGSLGVWAKPYTSFKAKSGRCAGDSNASGYCRVTLCQARPSSCAFTHTAPQVRPATLPSSTGQGPHL